MLSRHHQIALVDRNLERVLVVSTLEGPRLPRTDERWPDHRELVGAVQAPGAFLGGPPWREDDGTVTNVLFGGSSAIEGASWRGLGELDGLGLSAESAEGIRRTVRERRDGPPDDGRAAWFLPGWRDAVEAWVDEVLPLHGLARHGAAEAVKIWSLSAVLRFPVVRDGEAGDLWFKATCEGFHGEPALTQAVCGFEPDVMPRVLAVQPDHAWMLMEPIPDADDGVGIEHAADVARSLARLQLDTIDRLDELRAAGAPDRGLESTLTWLRTCVHDSIEQPLMSPEQRARAVEVEPLLVAAVTEFWSHGLPDALCHGDLHLGNVAWVDDHPVYFDWTDACVSHPYLDARHLADDAAHSAPEGEGDAVRQAVWEAYAEAWRVAFPGVDHDLVWSQARLVEMSFQMVSYEQIYRAQPEASRWELATIVVEVLDKLAEQLTAR